MRGHIFNDIKTEILSTITSDLLKQIIFFKSFNSVCSLCSRPPSAPFENIGFYIGSSKSKYRFLIGFQ